MGHALIEPKQDKHDYKQNQVRIWQYIQGGIVFPIQGTEKLWYLKQNAESVQRQPI